MLDWSDETDGAAVHAIPASSEKPFNMRRANGTAMSLKASQQKSSIHRRDVGEEEFDNVISEVAQYGRVQFWDARYAEETEPFEWYYPYSYFRDIIIENAPRDKRIMVAGVGSSTMAEDLAEDGYLDIVAQDISRVAIAQLRIRNKHLPQISYAACNMTDSDLPAGSFQAIVDKVPPQTHFRLFPLSPCPSSCVARAAAPDAPACIESEEVPVSPPPLAPPHCPLPFAPTRPSWTRCFVRQWAITVGA